MEFLDQLLNILFSIGMFLLMIGVIVAIHEGGHFLIGRMCNIRMLEYCIGFGKKPIFQKRMGKDQTLITIRLFPIGGFVKPLQEPKEGDTEERKFWDSLSEEEKNRSLERSQRWKRALMVFGGPASNFILAFFVLFGAYTLVGENVYKPMISDVVQGTIFEQNGFKSGDEIATINGKKINSAAQAHEILIYSYIKGDSIEVVTLDNKKANVNFSGENLGEFKNPGEQIGIYVAGKFGKITIQNVVKDGVADLGGMKKGDVITALDGIKMNNVSRVINTIGYTKKEAVDFTILRDGKEQIITLTPKYNDNSKRKLVGIEMVAEDGEGNAVVKKYGVGEAIETAYEKVVSSTSMQAIAIKKLITGELSYKNLSSPISMADYSGLTAKQGLFQYLNYIALISIAVGLFNLLPIPVLDGGHLLILSIEGLIRRDLSEKIMMNLQQVGMVMLIGVFVVALVNDLVKYLF
jgi:regulator of sigma E protease